MAKETVHCSICGKAITGKDFGERMRKLRKHRKEMHPTAHKRSVKKTLKTKRRKGIIHDPSNTIRIRKTMITKPKVVTFEDVEGRGLIRVLRRENGSHFPEFAIYPSEVMQMVGFHMVESLRDAGFREQETDKWVLRTNRFNIFVYL